jgi:hypothetical protein
VSLELLGKKLGMWVERSENRNTHYVIASSPENDDGDGGLEPSLEEWLTTHKPC